MRIRAPTPRVTPTKRREPTRARPSLRVDGATRSQAKSVLRKATVTQKRCFSQPSSSSSGAPSFLQHKHSTSDQAELWKIGSEGFHVGVRYQTQGNKGRGLFAQQTFNPGQIVFQERPLVVGINFATKPEKNKPGPPHQVYHGHICSHCVKSLAGSELAIPPPSPHRLQFANKLWPPANPVGCMLCGEQYCSEECRSEAATLYHKKLCANKSHASWLEFWERCRQLYTSYPLQVARMYSMLLDSFERYGNEEEAWKNSPISYFYSTSEFYNLPGNASEFIYDRAPALLKQILYKGKWESLFSKEAHAWLFNIVHLNCSSVLPQTPFNVYVENVKRIRPRAAAEDVYKHILDINQESAKILGWETDEIIAAKLTKSAGSGLFMMHSLMNHSCDPNVLVTTSQDQQASLHVVARKEIKEGDEISIDYVGFKNVNPFPTYQQRQEALRNLYGFECKCELCLAKKDALPSAASPNAASSIADAQHAVADPTPPPTLHDIEQQKTSERS